jgi:Ankyrin repeats (many copies)/Ankyrin repeat
LKERNDEGDLPLHVACKLKQPLAVIDLLVQQHPNAINEANGNGYLPLHLACAFNRSIEMVDFLVQQNPDTTKEKNSDGYLPLHLACAGGGQSLKVIQLLVQLQPNHICKRAHNGKTPLDYAKQPYDGQGPDPKIVDWLEAVASGQINLANLPPAQPNLSTGRGAKKTGSPISLLTSVVDKDLTKLPTAAADNEITRDRGSVLAILVDKKEMAAVSPSYVQSIRSEEIIGNGVFGTVYKGTDIALKRSFAIKRIKTDVLWGGHSACVQNAKEAFLAELKVRHVPHLHFYWTARGGCMREK